MRPWQATCFAEVIRMCLQEPLASISRYQPGELRFGLATLYQAFSTSPHAAARKTNGQSQGEQAAEAVQAEPADSASGNQQQQREQDGGPAGDAEPPTIEQLQAQLEQQREDQEAQVSDNPRPIVSLAAQGCTVQ